MTWCTKGKPGTLIQRSAIQTTPSIEPLAEASAQGELLVSDFGLARIGDSSLTATGNLLGTLAYMSPEQCLGKPGDVDHRTDIYSLGASLYEALVLRRAVGDGSPQALLQRIAFEDPVSLRTIDPTIPADLAAIIGGSMAKRRTDRYSSAQDLADDLQRFLNREPTTKSLPVTTHRRTRSIIGLVTLLASITIVSAIWLGGSQGDNAEYSPNISAADSPFVEPEAVIEFPQVRLTGIDARAGDCAGIDVAIDGDYAVVGMHHRKIDGNEGAGEVVVFRRTLDDKGAPFRQPGWSLQARLVAPSGQPHDQFGLAVAIAGDTIAVGANGVGVDIADTRKSTPSTGAVYSFRLIHGVWRHEQTIISPPTAKSFGSAVQLCGDEMVVGANAHPGGQGQVFVFRRQNGKWGTPQALKGKDVSDGDRFGHSLAFGNDTILVGAPWQDLKGPDSGAVHVFVRQAGGWTTTQVLAGRTGSQFGTSIGLDREQAVIGAWSSDERGYHAGAAYVYDNRGGSWKLKQKLFPKSIHVGDQLGRSVDIQSGWIVVGAPSHGKSPPNGGAVFLFRETTSGWQEHIRLTADDATESDNLGTSTAFGKKCLLVGTPWEDMQGTKSGAAYMFFNSALSE